MSALTDLLSTDAVRLEVAADDWRAAIHAAGGILVSEGISTAEYTEEMVRNVEDNGPYIVIAPGFALAHARPSPAVLRTGMSWVRLSRPVPFGHESNDPVELVVALAASDAEAHTAALSALARVLADPERTRALQQAASPEDVLAVLDGNRPTDKATSSPASSTGPGAAPGPALASGARPRPDAPADETSPALAEHKILTVCGNGVGTSLFLKNTLEQVLDRWGWSRQVSVEATDTISAKGKASEAVAILTSQEIARTLGDVGVPVKVVQDFTSTAEVDAVLRDTYSV
ncbi:PTS sugar transporter subunit IIA [Streptomyces fructofermentans]|uniref:Ascorbate-specific PTS system EIIA component n=1 Tax=Streptomyces fructofermentans TaxID=152141 RepID=A0A918KT05_9ACTN|nr:PTS sugar transporter subunit IIA [Streptomyces fructofermentans]GGX76037.1 PTS sugar transporter [Streptomyces fructofermentans]